MLSCFLRTGSFNSFRSDLIQANSVTRSASDLYFDFVLGLDTTFCFPKDQEVRISPRKTHCPLIYFLSSGLVAQSASENPIMSRSMKGLMCRVIRVGNPSPRFTYTDNEQGKQ